MPEIILNIIMSAYHDFLRSKEWQLKRSEVKERAAKTCDGGCERCGHRSPAMVVHHLTYQFGWLCDARWLAYLCSDCHDFIHGRSYYDPCKIPTIKQMNLKAT
mgnify:CR=1 FL=1